MSAVAAAEQAASALDPRVWIDEGHELAKKHAYSPEALQKIAAREGHPHLGGLNLSPPYQAEAKNCCPRVRVALTIVAATVP